jgi:hypothetical protein
MKNVGYRLTLACHNDVDIDLVLALVYLDIHLVYNLTYINSIWGLDSIGSPGLTLR